MDRQSGGGATWFDQALRQARIPASGMVRVESSRRPVVERNNPWHDPEGIEDAATVLAAALGGDPESARIVYVTDMDDDPIARVQAGVQLARAAVAQGMDVLLVDADIRHVGLTRWLPDRDLDAEGLVDVLQYGASVAAARHSTEIDGIEVLGVGSYRPDGAAVFGEDDLRRLVAQLRSNARVVVVVGPPRLMDLRFHPMVRIADVVVLSMHQDESLSESLGSFLAFLAENQRPLVGTFLWAGPDDSDRFVDDALLERSRVLPRVGAASPFPGRRPSPDERAAEPAPQSEASGPPTSPMPASRPKEEPEMEDEADRSTRVPLTTEHPDPYRDRPGRSSGLIRGIFIALAVVIVGFVGWWALTWRSVEPTRPRVQPPERPVAAAATDAATVVEPEAGVADPQVAADGAAAEGEDRAGPGDEPGDDGATPEPVETGREVESALAAPVESAPDLAGESEPADPFEAALTRAGDGGWGLHLTSFTDAQEAETDRARLARQGYTAVVRSATIDGTRWYRVLVGHFASRAEAARFREQAQEKFHADWVGVVRK